MMDFSDVINDLKKLEGMRLNSIRPGAEIVLDSVDITQKKIIVKTPSGKVNSRSFLEFQKIWDALIRGPVVRVEEILNGSGSSRNQPETIFANLPYIEWLKISNKKHITYTGKYTHPYGTLKQMNSFDINCLLDKLEEKSDAETRYSLISSDTLLEEIRSLEKISGINIVGIEEGAYAYRDNVQTIILVDSKKFDLASGVYLEVKTCAVTPTKYIVIGKYKIGIIKSGPFGYIILI